MKILGCLIIIAIVVMGYCVYNPMVVDSADSTDAEISPTEDCKGPFGVDSQKILNDDPDSAYEIGVVSSLDLEKNDDGTWYVDNCELSNWNNKSIYFTRPYPQQHDLKEGDFIGFTANFQSLIFGGKKTYYYTDVKVLDYISSQSTNCKIDGISGLSTPSRTILSSRRPSEEDFVNVTGLIMAVQTEKNNDPEPDDPSDYHIYQAAMKCADGQLYMVEFGINKAMFKYINVNLPGSDAFGEGDIVTVRQTVKVDPDDSSFPAYYKSKNR